MSGALHILAAHILSAALGAQSARSLVPNNSEGWYLFEVFLDRTAGEKRRWRVRTDPFYQHIDDIEIWDAPPQDAWSTP